MAEQKGEEKYSRKEELVIEICSSRKPLHEKVYALLESVERPGMKEFLEFLSTTDYFIAPASTKYHLCEEGGLLRHSYNVFWFFFQKNIINKMNLPVDSIIVTGLLHDLCKVGLYIKEPQGGYSYNPDVGDRGHGKLSVERIKCFIGLTQEEEAMILYHMGVFYAEKEYSFEALKEAISRFKCVQVFASTDMEASIYEDYMDNQSSRKIKKEDNKEDIKEEIFVSRQKVLEYISNNELNGSKGVPYEEIVSYFKEEEKVNKILENLLLEGTIFEPVAGFIKEMK